MNVFEPDQWYELMRSCPATPLTADGRELGDEEEELSPGNELKVLEERGDRLLLCARGNTPERQWRYLVQRADFALAISQPDLLPREGSAPTAPARTAGSPD